MINLHSVDVEVLGEINNGYRLKISILDIGVYIFGFTIRHSDKNESGWWVQPPAQLINGKWKSTIEFDKSKSLWLEIEQECIDSIKNYGTKNSNTYMPEDSELTDESIENSLNDALKRLDGDSL